MTVPADFLPHEATTDREALYAAVKQTEVNIKTWQLGGAMTAAQRKAVLNVVADMEKARAGLGRLVGGAIDIPEYHRHLLNFHIAVHEDPPRADHFRDLLNSNIGSHEDPGRDWGTWDPWPTPKAIEFIEWFSQMVKGDLMEEPKRGRGERKKPSLAEVAYPLFLVLPKLQGAKDKDLKWTVMVAQDALEYIDYHADDKTLYKLLGLK